MATLRLIDYVFTTYLVDNRIKAFVEYKGESVGSIDYYPTYSLNSGGKTYTGDEAVLKDLENQAKYYGITLNLPSGIKDFPKDGSSSPSQQTSPTQESTPPPQEQTTTSQENISLPPNSALLTNGNILSLKEGGGFGATYLIETSTDGNVIFTGQPSPSDFKTKVDARLTALKVTDPTINVVRYGETPEPEPVIVPPQEIKQQRADAIAQKEDTNLKESVSTLDPQSIENSVTEDSKPKGLQKIGQLLVNVAKNLAKQFIPVALNLIKQLGVAQFQEELTKLRAEHPEWNEEELQAQVKKALCPTKEQLDLIILQRDGLVQKLNAAGAKLDGLSVTINFGATFAKVLSTVVAVLKIAAFGVNQASKAIPLIPGAVTSIITDLNTIADTVAFKPDGTPNIPPLAISAAQVSPAVALVQSIIVKCVDLLDSIDQLILLCDPNATLVPMSNSINNIYDNELIAQTSDNGNTYKGFILEIETRPYTPRVDESRAVGKNKSGIIIIFTDWSFTSDTQVLIDEIKYIIDRDNLKAY